MLAHVGPETTIISGLPIVEDLATGQRLSHFQLREPVCWSAGEYLPRFVIVANSELGNPSCTLFRSDVLDRSEAAWDDEMSCDMAANVVATARGEVVLLPPGLVTISRHQGQDMHQQSIRKYYVRLTNTINYLSSCPDPGVREIAKRIACTESLYHVAMTANRCSGSGGVDFAAAYGPCGPSRSTMQCSELWILPRTVALRVGPEILGEEMHQLQLSPGVKEVGSGPRPTAQ